MYFFPLSKCSAEEPSAAPQPLPQGKAPHPAEAPTKPSAPALTPPPPTPPPPSKDSGQQPVLPKRRPRPLPPLLRPGWTGLPFLPGSTGVIMETGEAGPPGRMGMSGRGLPRGVDGQTGQGPIPRAEGYAGAPGKGPPLLGHLSYGR